jgi:hypothetical protein
MFFGGTRLYTGQGFRTFYGESATTAVANEAPKLGVSTNAGNNECRQPLLLTRVIIIRIRLNVIVAAIVVGMPLVLELIMVISQRIMVII